MQKITAYILLTFKFEKQEDSRWVGICEEFGVSNYGDTIDKAEEHLKNSVNLYLESLLELNELANVIKQNNVPIYFDKQKEFNIRVNEDEEDTYLRPSWFGFNNAELQVA